MPAANGRRAFRVRRSPHLVAYWRAGSLVACNYATGTSAEIPAELCALLDRCDEWTALDDLRDACVVARDAFPATVARLIALTLLERSDRRPDPRERAMQRLRPWNPQAGFFHATTRDMAFTPRRLAARLARAKAKILPPPAITKRYVGAHTVRLERPRGDDAFTRALRTRRTWRRYSAVPLTRAELATLLAWSAGVQQWVDAGGLRIPLKTSPSGGARHAIECYVVARHVRGLKSGIYHYAPDSHALHRISPAVPLARMRAYVPQSGYFANASVMVFFTAVFERILWRYPYPRAYRAALIEAGHVCQTFCLTAAWLGLAPYSVMALADSVIEQDLGIDGITESVLYGAGVGRPPKGTSWAPLPKGSLKARPNRHLASD